MRTAILVCLLGCGLGFNFLSIGDWGDVGAKEVAPTMAKYEPEFLLAIGDNFYNKGVKSVDDPQFKDKFEDTFTGSSLTSVPWYVCAGNHDYYGGDAGINAEIAYSNKSKRWVFPDKYYSKEITTKDGTSILLVSTDTWRLNGGDTFVKFDPKTEKSVLRSKELVMTSHKEGRIHKETRDLLIANFPEDDPANPLQVHDDDPQLTWVKNTLAASKADWKIVQGHFPVHSCTRGEHGDTPKLVKQLQPILEAGKADMYFNGHDHILQHIAINGVHYHGSGAGARNHTLINKLYKGLEGSAVGSYGFMVHNGTKTQVTTTFVLADGSKPYTYTLTKGKKLLD